MSRKDNKKHGGPDDFDILSAVWILASNDENPMITYNSVIYRLGLSDDYDMRNLIAKHGELFRRGVLQSRLNNWKQQMRENKRLPSWIRDIEDQAERQAAIDNLTTNDIFRSQFRAEREAPKSPVEIIDWGLKHIDRLRQAKLETYRQVAQRWEIWLVFTVGILNMIVTVVLFVASLSQGGN